MLQLFREIFKPAAFYLKKADYREWLSVKSACRNKKAGEPVTARIGDYKISGNDAPSFLYQYEEIFVNRSFDTDFGRKDPLIFCCGVNIGLEIFFFKKKYPGCRIVAFEADPGIAAVLKKNVVQNNLQLVEIHAVAVWTENGEINFEPDGALGGKTGAGKTKVPCERLAFCLNMQEKIDLLIMDIEGAELPVLLDCKEQLLKVENLFVEWHGKTGEEQNLGELLELLNSCGFRYRLNNKLPVAPFINRVVENGFDSMVEIYAQR